MYPVAQHLVRLAARLAAWAIVGPLTIIRRTGAMSAAVAASGPSIIESGPAAGVERPSWHVAWAL
jgi:N-methylhydantoinase A/oxoprolinase/acetone carboxylase beta subunit